MIKRIIARYVSVVLMAVIIMLLPRSAPAPVQAQDPTPQGDAAPVVVCTGNQISEAILTDYFRVVLRVNYNSRTQTLYVGQGNALAVHAGESNGLYCMSDVGMGNILSAYQTAWIEQTKKPPTPVIQVFCIEVEKLVNIATAEKVQVKLGADNASLAMLQAEKLYAVTGVHTAEGVFCADGLNLHDLLSVLPLAKQELFTR